MMPMNKQAMMPMNKPMNRNAYEIKSLERNAIFQIKIAFFLVVRKA